MAGQTRGSKSKSKSASSGKRVASRREGLLLGLGRKVRALRSKQRWSQQVLAKISGLSPRFIAQLEGGQGNISIAKLDDVAQALGVTVAGLLRFDVLDSVPADQPADKLRGEILAMLESRSLGELMAVRSLLVGGVAGGHSKESPKIISLLGLRGSGKSTLGPLVAKALRMKFVELNDAVAMRCGLEIKEIYELHGEAFFRRQEFMALRALIEKGDQKVVVAISGGAVSNADTFSLLHACTLPVWLKARPEELFIRTLTEDKRWLSADRHEAVDDLRKVYNARELFFEKSRIIIDTTAKSPEICVRQLIRDIKGVH
ncbi:MAG: helix-turn-helix domain-containing protein [Deltaproteobacteria bacterium]|nr:helix-turn-helix domain-containing protein [Deltaproteobacteria bacterium]